MSVSRWPSNLVLSLGLALLAFGCARNVVSVSFLKPEIDLSLIRRVAVLPLDNLSREQMANEKVQRILVSELLATGAFEVIDPGEVNRAVAELGPPAAAGIKVEEVKRLGRSLNVQALVMGSVVEYGEVRSGAVSAPLVSLALRIVETERGAIIWSSSVSEGGITLGTRLLGSSRDTISEVTIKAIRKSIYTLFPGK